MKIIIKENASNIETGIYTLQEIAEMMQVLVDAIKTGERVAE